METRANAEVQILGQTYTLRGQADHDYLTTVAEFVDRKMREVTERVPVASPSKVAVLAALNIADELFQERRRRETDEQARATRDAELARTLDRALEGGG